MQAVLNFITTDLFNKLVASFLPMAMPRSANADISSSKSTLPKF